MNKFQPKQVIVTSLTLAMLIGGSALYTSKERAFAETADKPIQQSAVTDSNKTEHSRFHHKMPILEEASLVLGMDKKALLTALEDKSLVDIAKEKGLSEADLISKLKATRSEKIDEAVQAGKIKAENAAQIKSKMAKHLKFMVNHKGSGSIQDTHEKKKWKDNEGILPAPDKLAAILGVTKEELKQEMKAGKSLTEIAQSKGISKEQLITRIKDEITPWIHTWVDRKRHQPSIAPEATDLP